MYQSNRVFDLMCFCWIDSLSIYWFVCILVCLYTCAPVARGRGRGRDRDRSRIDIEVRSSSIAFVWKCGLPFVLLS